MPDNASPMMTPQNQIDWHGMLHDLEKSIELMSDSLDGVRTAVRRLVMAEAWLPQTTVEPQYATPAHPPVPSEAFEPVADQMTSFAMPSPMAEEMHVHAEPVADLAPPSRIEEEASRELVQRVVDDMRAEQEEASAAMAAAEQERDAHEARHAMEEARAEQPPVPMTSSDVAPPVWSEEESREAVRRAVEQAKAEMASGRMPALEEAAPLAARPLPQRPVNPQHLLPTLTIEDPESRVELSRVYGLLQRLGVASQASLLNYTSRQVSVMLGADAARLTMDDFVSAVRQTMGRRSQARQDGANVIVELAGAKEEAA